MEQANTNQEKTSPDASVSADKKKKYGWGRKIAYGLIALAAFILIVQVAIADKYKMQVQVIEGEKKVGVNPTTELLDFGDLSGDTSATRVIAMKAGGMDTFVHVLKFGSAAELVKVSENNFTMKSGDEKKLELAMYMPPSAPVGTWYKGWVMIFKIPKFW